MVVEVVNDYSRRKLLPPLNKNRSRGSGLGSDLVCRDSIVGIELDPGLTAGRRTIDYEVLVSAAECYSDQLSFCAVTG